MQATLSRITPPKEITQGTILTKENLLPKEKKKKTKETLPRGIILSLNELLVARKELKKKIQQ